MNIHNILSGANKTLRVANEVIPLYKDAKPLIKKTTSFINNFKIRNEKKLDNKDKKIEIKEIKKTITNSNNPKFFK